ncbi:nucleotide exchange factor GrpE [Reinekea marina]|uniref:Protein GrpE n=1 Tax=Reinekea marina TaxID=1310421 RepID=A0ABV7WMR3_9GAMM|nr:nucleotide exchange factor GrpE [Reinekea marina]MDN3650687.1 nucleotide exchange factor GrpE [Reinekea marina]
MSNEEKPVEEQLESETVEEPVEASEAVESEESDDLAAQLASAQEEAAKYKDQFIRSEAEMANLRRRVEKDVENAHKFGQEKISKELLSVADNLERAILASESDSAEVKALKEGVEMTLKGLLDVFAKFNIVAIDPQGEPFDPQLHQAMSMVENPDVEPNTVIAVMQKGYTLHDRLIRPAMVMVSKSAEQATTIDEKA